MRTIYKCVSCGYESRWSEHHYIRKNGSVSHPIGECPGGMAKVTDRSTDLLTMTNTMPTAIDSEALKPFLSDMAKTKLAAAKLLVRATLADREGVTREDMITTFAVLEALLKGLADE